MHEGYLPHPDVEFTIEGDVGSLEDSRGGVEVPHEPLQFALVGFRVGTENEAQRG